MASALHVSPFPNSSPFGRDNGTAMKQEDHRLDSDSASSRSSTGVMGISHASGDPNRPKRKKAKRACAVCQKSHITCSDERPCASCVSKNKVDLCVDGPRKKAKYLHDAPNEALSLGQRPARSKSNTTVATTADSSSTADADGGRQQAFAGSAKSDRTVSLTDSQSMPPPLPDPRSFNLYNSGQSPMSSSFSSLQASPLHGLAAQTSAPPTPLDSQQGLPSQFVDASDPGLFNFDLPSMNFGNHYGALEFGMLGHMSSGSTDTALNSLQSPMDSGANFSNQGFDPGQQFADGQLGPSLAQGSDVNDWGNNQTDQGPMMPAHESMAGNFNDPWSANAQPIGNAYAIGTGGGSFSAQSTASSMDVMNVDPSVVSSTSQQQFENALPTTRKPSSDTQSLPLPIQEQPPPTPRATEPSEAISKNLPKSLRTNPTISARCIRDPSSIYSAVTKPYPYTAAFHRMYEMLKRRFDSKNKVRIAKALSSIRPSFISLNRTLTSEDLVFMEKCFQRGLWDYEDFASSCGTPTIICRRTGEIAHAVKEFTLLSKWPTDVLLGRSPNLNTNTIKSSSGEGSGTATNASSRGGHNTPNQTAPRTDMLPASLQTQDIDSAKGKNQPIFLAELLDDDSVVKFYEDFSRLAFADSKGYAWSPCKLLRYRAASDISISSSANSTPAATHREARFKKKSDKSRPLGSSSLDGKSGAEGSSVIKPEDSLKRLGERAGFVNCMYCWYVKRDVFNIPNMIVLNFLPIV